RSIVAMAADACSVAEARISPLWILYERRIPVARSDQEDAVFHTARLDQGHEAVPDRHEDDFRAFEAQGARGICIRGIPTNHHPDFSKIGLEDRIIGAR